MRVYSTDNGWGLFKDESGEARGQTHRYRRTYTWNSRNQLVSSVDANYSTSYVYGQDGQRSNKYTQGSETLYSNKMWTLHTDNGNSVYGGQYAKNVYLGETRIVTKLARADQKTAHEETYKQYYYHSDHLGSATMISDWEGKEYQRIEYTPYGETWVEKTNNSGSEFLPYRFTGKEVDQETGLYYYGARYLDPKYSMWISTDPALGEYIPEIGKGNSKNSANLPGMGGVYNHINGNLYAYAANNPIKYTDPDGEWTFDPHNPMRIIANLDDLNDLRSASELLVDPSLGYTITAYGETSGITKNFGKYSEIYKYLNPNKSYDIDVSLYPEQNIKEHDTRRHQFKEVSVLRYKGKSDDSGFSQTATFFSANGDFDTPVFIGAYAAVLDGTIAVSKKGHVQLQGTLCQAGVRAGFRGNGYKVMASFGGDIGGSFEVMFSNDGIILDISMLLNVRLEFCKDD